MRLAVAYVNGFMRESSANMLDPAEQQTRDELVAVLCSFAVDLQPAPQTAPAEWRQWVAVCVDRAGKAFSIRFHDGHLVKWWSAQGWIEETREADRMTFNYADTAYDLIPSLPNPVASPHAGREPEPQKEQKR